MIKEYKLEDINPVADIIEKVWRSVDVLRSYIRSTDYYVVLFILSLQKDGILSCLTKEKNPNKIKQDILKCIESSENDNKEGYQTIYKIFEPLLKNLPTDAIIHLIALYNELNQEKLKEHFSEIFDDILYKISISQGRETGEFVQPIEISRLFVHWPILMKTRKFITHLLV
jgi:type I restriction-modification system DNA methylase subunit